MVNTIRQKAAVLIMHKATNYILIASIFAAALSYIYFANIAVRTLTTLGKTKEHLQSLSIEVSEMESKRLTIENSINAEKALSLGFVEVNHPTFVMKKNRENRFVT